MIEKTDLGQHGGHSRAHEHIERSLTHAPIEPRGKLSRLVTLNTRSQSSRTLSIGRVFEFRQHRSDRVGSAQCFTIGSARCRGRSIELGDRGLEHECLEPGLVVSERRICMNAQQHVGADPIGHCRALGQRQGRITVPGEHHLGVGQTLAQSLLQGAGDLKRDLLLFVGSAVTPRITAPVAGVERDDKAPPGDRAGSGRSLEPKQPDEKRNGR